MKLPMNGATLLFSIALLSAQPPAANAQILETETARFLPAGTFELGTGYEFQTSSEGTEHALPFAAEWGVTDRFSLLLEPVAYTAIRPNTGPHATGAGDLEATAIAMVRSERGGWPAFAVAFEIKFPTSESLLIGTDQTDYAGYLIGSKRIGRLNAHANVGYTILGKPPGTNLNNILNGALAGEYFLNERVEIFGEVLGNTSSSSEGGDNATGTSTTTPEAAGGELVGTLGMGLRPSRGVLLSLGLSYDNNQALQVRPGVTVLLP